MPPLQGLFLPRIVWKREHISRRCGYANYTAKNRKSCRTSPTFVRCKHAKIKSEKQGGVHTTPDTCDNPTEMGQQAERAG